MQTINSINEINLLKSAGQVTGLYKMDRKIYDQIDAINYSKLKNLHPDASPADYLFARENPEEAGEEAIFGLMTHCAMFEPERFEERYPISKEARLNWSTTPGKVQQAWYKEECAKGKIPVFANQFEVIQQSVQRFSREPKARKILESPFLEVVALWIDEDTGLFCKAGIDAIVEGGMVVDLKTSKNPTNRHKFLKTQVYPFQYDWQAAMYLDAATAATGIPHDQFMWATLQTAEPFSMNLFTAHASVIQKGRREYKHALCRLKECLERDEWPDHVEVVEIGGGY